MKDKAAAATEEAQKGISVHQFSLNLSAENGVVFGQVVKYGEQCDQVWVGNGGKESAALDDIVLAIGGSGGGRSGGGVSATKVYGPSSDGAGAAGSGVDDISESFARKLNAKLSKAVYFSYACSSKDSLFVTEVQKALFAHIKANRNHF